jgi:hypothetical protein
LSIRFQADNDLKRIIVDATLRREPRIDFQTAQAARLDGLDDRVVLRQAESRQADDASSARLVCRLGQHEPGSVSRHPSERADT